MIRDSCPQTKKERQAIVCFKRDFCVVVVVGSNCSSNASLLCDGRLPDVHAKRQTLIQAIEKGGEVSGFVEVMSRFDESRSGSTRCSVLALREAKDGGGS
jgi:4-hydroxy-3-methylbut-2-enyl diphosphate reductase IspH